MGMFNLERLLDALRPVLTHKQHQRYVLTHTRTLTHISIYRLSHIQYQSNIWIHFPIQLNGTGTVHLHIHTHTHTHTHTLVMWFYRGLVGFIYILIFLLCRAMDLLKDYPDIYHRRYFLSSLFLPVSWLCVCMFISVCLSVFVYLFLFL